MVNRRQKQSGAVSLFVVLFAALLITVITVSFLRLMMSDQRQASNADLSQSAYDSALAGVEDGKRALIRHTQLCDGRETAATCVARAQQINAAGCNEALRFQAISVAPGSDGEVLVQQSTNGNDKLLDQAYTCVTINLETDDYIGSMSPNELRVIPLVGVSSFNKVKVEWFSNDDVSGSDISIPDINMNQLLISGWPSNRPSVLRAQIMQHGTSFTLDDFDRVVNSQSNTNTLFLYPAQKNIGLIEAAFSNRDMRRSGSANDPSPSAKIDTPLPVSCEESIASGGYACSMTLSLPQPVGGGDRTAFLGLSGFYNATHFRVTLLNSNTPVKFNGVQPEIDSTGRASDLFRRVATRVDLVDTSFPYPNAAVQVIGDFCKNFTVTNNTSDFRNLCN